jgi:hypothetical protein
MSSKKLLSTLVFFIMLTPSYGAMSFDGSNDYVDAGTSAILDVDYVTISAWINASSWDSGSFNYIVSKETVASPYHGYELRNSFGSIQFVVAIGVTEYLLNSTLPTTGVWHHLAGTYDGETMLLYVDGAQVNSNTSPSGVMRKASGQSLYIGEGQAYPNRRFVGQIDDVRIYNRALSASEIQSLALSRSRLLITDGLVGWWKLDDGINGETAGGATARDSSGNGNTGTPTNGPIWKASQVLNYP